MAEPNEAMKEGPGKQPHRRERQRELVVSGRTTRESHWRLRVRVRVIQMVFLLLCVAEPDETTEKSSEKQPHGRER